MAEQILVSLRSDDCASPKAVRDAQLEADRDRRLERKARFCAAMQDAMQRYDRGAAIADLWPSWHERTGLSCATLVKVVHGVYDTKIARALNLVREAARDKPKRRHRLTPDVLQKIRAAEREGVSIYEIAGIFQIDQGIVRAVVKGRYATSAMKTVLAMEAASPSRF